MLAWLKALDKLGPGLRQGSPELAEGLSANGSLFELSFIANQERKSRLRAAFPFQSYEGQALARIGERDPDDWPALACALLLSCPIWTEDADFFGTGVATWTISRIRLYLSPDE